MRNAALEGHEARGGVRKGTPAKLAGEQDSCLSAHCRKGMVLFPGGEEVAGVQDGTLRWYAKKISSRST